MPNGSATAVATTAIRIERRIAVHSSGVNSSTNVVPKHAHTFRPREAGRGEPPAWAVEGAGLL